MSACHTIIVLGAMLPGALLAQDEAARKAALAEQRTCILFGPDFGRFDEATHNLKETAVTRFVEILRHLPVGDAPARSLGLTVGRSNRGPVFHCRGTQAQLDTVAAAIHEMRRGERPPVCLHLSLVTMPIAVAKAHRLQPGQTVVADEVAWTELMRDAAKAKGSVRNLPEVITGALAPFVREAATSEGPADRPRLRVRGETVPIDASEVALALEVERVTGPAAENRRPVTLAKPVFRLAAGKSAMMMAVDGESAIVVIARCLEAAPMGK